MKPSLGAIPEMLYCNRASGGPPDAPFEANVDMKWFRSNIRLGSRLALFALAIQFLLSFGHFHGGAQAAAATAFAKPSGVHGTFDLAASRARALERASQAIAVVGSKKSSDHGPAGHTGDDCAICAVMALANAMVDAAPPGLLTPHAIAFSYSVADVDFVDWHAASRAFQPRAPPIA